MAPDDARRRFGRSVVANVRFWLGATDGRQGRSPERLDAERHNIFRAIEFGLQYREGWPESGQLLLQCVPFVERRGHGPEWVPLLGEAIARCGRGDLPLKCHLLNRLGQLKRQRRDWEAALNAHQEAMATAQDLGSELLVAQALYYVTTVHVNKGALAEAEQLGQQALAMFQRLDDGTPEIGKFMAPTLNELGQVARWRGQFDLAEAHYREAIGIWRRLGEDADLGTTVMNLAENVHAAGRLQEALPLYEEAIERLGATGSRVRLALALMNMGALYHAMGEDLPAEQSFRKVDLPFLRRTGNTFYQAIAAQGLGTVLMSQGRLEAAASYLEQSHTLWSQLGDEINLANAKGSMAELLQRQDRVEEANRWYADACQLLERHPDHAWARKLLAKFSQALKDRAQRTDGSV